MCAIWQANSKSRMMFHVKHRRLSESVLNCILFPLYRLMQRGCDSVWIDLLDVIIVGRWRLLKAHRLQNRWIGMFHVKHRSINCVDELVRRIVRGRTCGISPVAHHAVVLQPELCAVGVMNRLHMNPGRSVVLLVCWCRISPGLRKSRIQNRRARAWWAYEGNCRITMAAGILPERESHQATIWHL